MSLREFVKGELPTGSILSSINGTTTYIKYCETDLNNKREQGIVQEEVLIDNMYYQKRSFDKYGHLTNTENIYVGAKDK